MFSKADFSAGQVKEFKITIDENADLLPQLKKWREAVLDSKSWLLQKGNQAIRVFPQDSSSNEVRDCWARGLDIARAAIEIFHNPEIDDEQVKKIVLEYARHHHRHFDLEKMTLEVQTLHDLLVEQLIRLGPAKNSKQATLALALMRDFLWQRDFAKPYAVVDSQDDQLVVTLNEPLKLDISLKPSPWDDLAEQPWYKKLAKRLGNPDWFEAFQGEFGREGCKLTSTPMTRLTPNPANAWQVREFYFPAENEQAVEFGRYTRTAITEPYSMDSKLIEDATLWNHRQLFAAQKADVAAAYEERWGWSYENDSITRSIPWLHQTLVADGVVGTPDQSKGSSSSILDRKMKAHDDLRAQAENTNYQVNGNEYKFKFLATNHCINMWEKRGRIRDRDRQDSQALISFLVGRMNQFSGDGDMSAILAHLRLRNDSWFYHSLSHESIDQAIKNVSDKIQKGQPPFTIPANQRENVILSLLAAIELKSVLHESTLSRLRRQVSNWSHNHLRHWYFLGLGHAADIGIRFGMTLLSAAKWFNLVYISETLNEKGRRKELWFAAYESLLAENLGLCQGGCMSAVDRAGEKEALVAGLRRQFISEKKILGYQDSPAERKAFIENYTNTRLKHTAAEMATGCAATKDDETLGRLEVKIFGKRINLLGWFSTMMPTRQEASPAPVSRLMEKMRDVHYKGRAADPRTQLGRTFHPQVQEKVPGLVQRTPTEAVGMRRL